jgi:DNA replication protein DnaC
VKCGRTFSTVEIAVHGLRFPGDRYCVGCREADAAEAHERAAEMAISRCGIPRQYADCSFANFQCPPGDATAFRLAQDWSRELRQGRRPRRGLLLEGDAGRGKTHLAVAILKEVVFVRQLTAAFLNVPEWLNGMKQAFAGDDAGLAPTPRWHQLVVLDDLGTEKASDWSRDQIYSLVNHREANGLLTIVTTNLAVGELHRRLGSPTMSRLNKMCKRVSVESRMDYRENAAADDAA